MSELVDMNSVPKRIHQAVSGHTSCPAALRSGFSDFAQALTASHTLTSRRYSVWGLLKLHVDEPFAATLAYSGPWDAGLLRGFRPSNGWREPGRSVMGRLATFRGTREPDESDSSATGAAPAREAIAPARTRRELEISASDIAPADKAIHAMERWIQCLRLAIHSCDESSSAEPPPLIRLECLHFVIPTRDDARYVGPSELASFTDALNLMREVLHLLKRLRPRHRIVPKTPQAKGPRKVLDHADRGQLCCELCWRPSMRWVASLRSHRLPSSNLKSARFCEVHDPSDPRSRYRTDLRYKAAFLQELEAVCNFSESAYAFELPGLPRPDEHMLRRLAYDRVHFGARTRNARNPSLKERVWVLLQNGRSQAEVARELGISRQAVSSARKKLRAIWDDHQLRLQDYLLLCGQRISADAVESYLRSEPKFPAFDE